MNEHNLLFHTKNMLATMFEIFSSPIFIRLLPILVETQLAQAFYLLYFHKKSHAVPSVLKGVKDFLINLHLYRGKRAKVAGIDDRKIMSKFIQSLIMFEEGRSHEKLTRLFLAANNLYIRLVLRSPPINDIIYLKKSPR